MAACPFPAGRGSQLLIERTARGLAARGHTVEVLAPRSSERGREDPVPILRAGLTTPAAIDSRPHPQRLVDLVLLLQKGLRHVPDVFVGHNVDAGIAAGLLGRTTSRPSLYVRHSDFAAELAHYGPWAAGARALGGLLDRCASRLATRIAVLGTCPPRLDAGEAGRVDAFPPPLDPDEAPIAPADGRTLYYEGNEDPYQNPDWLDYALEAARRRDPGVRLIRAVGPRERPGAADLALVPRSIGGGFPMKLITYQSAGIPAVCVASGAPGMQDGLDAFVVPGRGSPDAFASRVVEALADSDRRRAVGKSAQARARERSDPARVAKLLERTLERARREHRKAEIAVP